MKKYYVIVTSSILLSIAVIFVLCSSSTTESIGSKTPACDSISTTSAAHKFRSPYIPEEVDFAGERLPLEYFDVRECFEREMISLMNFHSSMMLNIKRVTMFFPIIEPILASYDIPDDFKYLSLVESDLRNRISPAGATGYWQFMEAAAKEYKLEISAEVDERYHLEKSTEAACKYLKAAHKSYGNWTMAAASYNMGRGGLNRQVQRQLCDNYYDLLLNEETTRYIYRIAAMKLIVGNPQQYGFDIPESEKYQPVPCTEIKVNTSQPDLVEFAYKNKTNYKMLKLLNPWLRDVKLTNAAKKEYIIKIPVDGYRDAMQHRIAVKEE